MAMMSFGKFKGRLVEEVLQQHPDYFLWMKANDMTQKPEYEEYLSFYKTYPECYEWEIDIRDGYHCWKCNKTLRILLLFLPDFLYLKDYNKQTIPLASDLAYSKPKSLIDFALNYGVIIEDRYSKSVEGRYLMHICPNCRSGQGDYHVVEDNEQETTLLHKFKIIFDRNSNSWIKSGDLSADNSLEIIEIGHVMNVQSDDFNKTNTSSDDINKPKPGYSFGISISLKSILGIFIFLLVAITTAEHAIFWAIDKTIGPWLNEVLESYFMLPTTLLIFFITPRDIVSSFGLKPVTDAQIQQEFDKHHAIVSNHTYLYADLYFPLLILVIILAFYYKYGVIKGKLRWLSRYIFMSFSMGLPLTYFISETYFKSYFHPVLTGHYSVIFKKFQELSASYLLLWLATSLFLSILGHILILFVGKNKVERDLKKQQRLLEKQQRRYEKERLRKEKLQKAKEYY